MLPYMRGYGVQQCISFCVSRSIWQKNRYIFRSVPAFNFYRSFSFGTPRVYISEHLRHQEKSWCLFYVYNITVHHDTAGIFDGISYFMRAVKPVNKNKGAGKDA